MHGGVYAHRQLHCEMFWESLLQALVSGLREERHCKHFDITGNDCTQPWEWSSAPAMFARVCEESVCRTLSSLVVTPKAFGSQFSSIVRKSV